jgi:hypothetical protein
MILVVLTNSSSIILSFIKIDLLLCSELSFAPVAKEEEEEEYIVEIQIYIYRSTTSVSDKHTHTHVEGLHTR